MYRDKPFDSSWGKHVKEMRRLILPTVLEPKRCPDCGKGLLADASRQTCPYCGAQLSVTEIGALLGKNEKRRS